MLRWILGGLLLLGGLAVAAVVIDEIISRESIKREARKKELFGKLIIDAVDRNTNVVKLSALEKEDKLEITGTGIANDLKVGDVIYV